MQRVRFQLLFLAIINVYVSLVQLGLLGVFYIHICGIQCCKKVRIYMSVNQFLHSPSVTKFFNRLEYSFYTVAV